MGAISIHRRNSPTAAPRSRASGFSLLESLFTLSLAGIVLAIALPSFCRLNADIRTRTTAEQLTGALRLAQISAVTKNRPAALMLTNATPGPGAAAAANGNNWLVKFLPSSQAGPASADLVQVATVALQNHVTLTGPAQVCFDAQGVQASTASPLDGASAACAQPGAEAGGVTSYLVSRTGATRQFKVRVHRNGHIELCDAAKAQGDGPSACLL